MEMKKCKECGKLFTPSNPRQQYCTDKHFRPCPVCSKPVEIKYLSDPTPRCADCRKSGLKTKSNAKIVGPSTIQVSTDSLDTLHKCEDWHTMKYTGKSNFGFVTDHVYVIRLVPNLPYGFIIEAIKDVTDDDDTDISLPISSMLSYGYFFKEVA